MASTTASPPTRRQRRSRARTAPVRTRDLLVIVAAGVGLLVSAYLALIDVAGGNTLCLAGTDCDIVRASTYGQVIGLPVAGLGVVFFLTVLLTAVYRSPWSPGLLQTLGGVGLGAAVVLVALQGLVLRAWCPYCLVADAAALTIGLRVLWSRQAGYPAGSLARGVVGATLAVVVLIAGYALNPPATAGAKPAGSMGTGAAAGTSGGAAAGAMSPDRLAALADHLRERGAVFYGAYWCPHCQEQKQAFGAAASRLPYVECDPRGTDARPDLCQAGGVRAYPTWVIDGQKIEGEVVPSELARRIGFDR